jgi:hypothetical protein
VVPGLLEKLLTAMGPGLHEVKIGGFKLRYVATPYPDIVPIAGIRAVIWNNVELVFKSKVAGWTGVKQRISPQLLRHIPPSIRHRVLKVRL